MAAIGFVILALAGAFAVVSARRYVEGGTLSPNGIEKPAPKLPHNRPLVPLGNISPYLPEAVIAVEDNDFKTFPAVDPIAIGRAALADLSGGSFGQGGSTITEQLMKQLFIKPQARDKKLLGRRLDESVLALEYARYHTRAQILRNYLNVVYFGEGAYGAQAASRTYFGVPAGRLDLDQAATLAALIQDPGYLDPRKHPGATIKRRNLVLEDMLRQKLISRPVYDKAVREPLKVSCPGLASVR